MFYKLLGTGQAGFSPKPDWSTYGLLQTWESQAHADAFFAQSKLMTLYKSKAREHYGLFLKNMISRGEWSGANPFIKNDDLDTKINTIVVITRATIKTSMLWRFWKFVPHSQKSIWNNKGLVLTMGIGEVPFRQMATFSLWKNQTSLDQFAYQTKNHVDAIKKTRELNWYNEELFSRFQPYQSFGTWNDKDPLNNI